MIRTRLRTVVVGVGVAILAVALSGCVSFGLGGSLAPLPSQTSMELVELADGGAVEVSDYDGWPSVTLPTIDTFSEDFRAVAAAPRFADGGTFTLQGDGRLQIVWIPHRTTLYAIDAIVGLARDYPQVEILLQATTAGPQWPILHIAGVTVEEAADIQARLLDPVLADADVEGYGLPFIMRVATADDPLYLEGNLGGVVD